MFGCKEKKSLKGVTEFVQVFGECLPLLDRKRKEGEMVMEGQFL